MRGFGHAFFIICRCIMKVAVVGSRTIKINNLGKYLPPDTTEIISGGARGVDTSAREYALSNSLKLTEILPEYNKYGRAAPIKRNYLIVDAADMVIAFWDGKSRGTKYVIDYCERKNKIVNVIICKKMNEF